MNQIQELNIINFGVVYLLLLVVLAIMKKCKVNQTKLLVIASIRMTLQLIIAGILLTYIFENPHPLFVIGYFCLMTGFAIYTVLSRNKTINKRFKIIVSFSLATIGLVITAFFIIVIVDVNIFNPQYTIPISGMVIGNAMTGVSLGLKQFNDNIHSSQNKISALLNIGSHPQKILTPFVNTALETAMLPTLNSMLGMGIISLPGMMTGQILAGTLPTTAILYQISIIIAICTVTTLAVFSSLYFGSKTLFNSRGQLKI